MNVSLGVAASYLPWWSSSLQHHCCSQRGKKASLCSPGVCSAVQQTPVACVKGEPALLEIYFTAVQIEQEYDWDQQGPSVRLQSDNLGWAGDNKGYAAVVLD